MTHGRLATMLNPRAVLAVGCAGWLAACATGESTDSSHADIAKIAEVKSTFGPQFQVTNVPPTGIDPRLLSLQKLPDGLKFAPANCAEFATGQVLPAGLQGNMAAVSAEGDGNRFVIIALETSSPVPVADPGQDCQKVGFAGGPLRGLVEVVEAPQIDGAQTPGVHRVLQTVIDGKPLTAEEFGALRGEIRQPATTSKAARHTTVRSWVLVINPPYNRQYNNMLSKAWAFVNSGFKASRAQKNSQTIGSN